MGNEFAAWADTGSLTALPLRDVQVVMSMRLCVICAETDYDAVAALAVRLKNVSAAHAFATFAGNVQDLWPEAFTINPPCCSRLSVDEYTVLDLVRAARSVDRHRFHAIVADFLPQSAAAELFYSAIEFAGAVQSVDGVSQ